MSKSLFSVLLALSTLLGCQSAMTANGAAVAAESTDLVSGSVTWFDGKRQRTAWISAQEFAEFGVDPAAVGQRSMQKIVGDAVPVKTAAGVRIWRTASAKRALRSVGGKNSRASLSPVFYPTRQGGPRMALNGRLVVRFKAEWSLAQIERWAERQGVRLLKPVLESRNIYLFQAKAGLAALTQANAIQRSGEVEYATPDWWQEAFLR